MKSSRTSIVANSVGALALFLKGDRTREIETIRLARAAWSLTTVGCSLNHNLRLLVTDSFKKGQRPDKGWTDPEDTGYAIATILHVGSTGFDIVSAIRWVNAARAVGGGWGRHPRDRARLPLTGLLSVLVPQVFEEQDLAWAKRAWKRDLEGPVRLSYKGGFFLLAMADRDDDSLVGRTISYLIEDQNEDGGFGPWKNHPIGSDPWSTGVVLWGLSKWADRVEAKVFDRALSWLSKTQLPSGYWPYHYLDEGTSYALLGAVSAMKALASLK